MEDEKADGFVASNSHPFVFLFDDFYSLVNNNFFLVKIPRRGVDESP